MSSRRASCLACDLVDVGGFDDLCDACRGPFPLVLGILVPELEGTLLLKSALARDWDRSENVCRLVPDEYDATDRGGFAEALTTLVWSPCAAFWSCEIVCRLVPEEYDTPV